MTGHHESSGKPLMLVQNAFKVSYEQQKREKRGLRRPQGEVPHASKEVLKRCCSLVPMQQHGKISRLRLALGRKPSWRSLSREARIYTRVLSCIVYYFSRHGLHTSDLANASSRETQYEWVVLCRSRTKFH